jgi:MtfA peptidase
MRAAPSLHVDPRRRAMRRRHGLPRDAAALAETHLRQWHRLDDDDRRRLLEIADWLLTRKRWEAARGFALDDTVRVVVGVQAALLVLGLDVGHYRQVSAVVVHASTARTRGERAGLIPGTRTSGVVEVFGLAQDRRGPVVIAWDRALADARGENPGHNVVLHEFAHKLDVRDGTFDGTPSMRREDVAEWARVCAAIHADLQAGVPRPPLQAYGATNPAEFFAVGTEAFFELPVPLRAGEPELYRVLARFYRQDPAAREDRRG